MKDEKSKKDMTQTMIENADEYVQRLFIAQIICLAVEHALDKSYKYYEFYKKFGKFLEENLNS